MAHGVHPNFTEKHEEHHRPEMQKGLVIKHNANQRYATSGITAFLFKEVAKAHSLPTQVLFWCFKCLMATVVFPISSLTLCAKLQCFPFNFLQKLLPVFVD